MRSQAATRLTIAVLLFSGSAVLFSESARARSRRARGPAAPQAARSNAEACRQELSVLESAVGAAADDLQLGARYRQAAIRCEQFDRSIEFFERLVKAHSASAHAHINLGLAYIDKIPPSSDLRQALLGRSAVQQFTKALALRRTWLAYYTRGVARLYYPNIFGVWKDAADDLERALAAQKTEAANPYFARTYVALGDTYYWRFHDLERARRTWTEGAAQFPDEQALRLRLASPVLEMREIVRKAVSPDVRVDTSLRQFDAEK